MTTGLTGPNYREDVQYSIKQEAHKTERHTTTSSQTATIKGNITSSTTAPPAEETQSYAPAFVDPTAELPQLPVPGQKTPTYATAQEEAATPDETYKSTLSEMVKQLEGTNTSLARAVQFVLAHPNGNYTSGEFAKAAQLALQYQQTALAQTRTATGNSSYTAPETDTASTDAQLATQQEGLFESIVQSNSKLTDNEKGQLLLAYNHPELLSKDALSQKLQQLLAQYTNAAQTMMVNSGFIPKGYVLPKNSESFDTKASFTFSQIFQQQAQKNGASAAPPFGTKEMNYLLYSLNYPEGPKPPLPPGRTQEEMDAFFNQTFGEAQTAFTQQTGLSASYVPTINTALFDAKLLASFENAFEKQLATQSPPLTEEQKTLLRTALGQQPENIPKEIQALFQTIKGNAMAEVIKTFNLPASWQPKTRNLNDPQVIKKKQEVQNQMNAVQTGQEMTTALSSIADLMTPGPTQFSIRSYLRAVTDALENLSISLSGLMIIDAQASSKMTKAQTDTNLDLLRIQQHKANEAWEKEQKAAKLNKIMGAIMAIFMGPVGIVLAVQKAETGTNFFEKMVKNIRTSINSANMPAFIKAILKAFANLMFTILASQLGGPFMALQQVQEGWSTSISDFAQAFGTPKAKADKIGSYTSMAILITAEIAFMIGTAGLGASLFAGSLGTIMNTVSAAVRTAVKTALETLQNVAKFITTKLPDLMRGASQHAAQLLSKVQNSSHEVDLALRALQKAVTKAKETPNVANLTRVERATEEYASAIEKLQKHMRKLGDQLHAENYSSAATQVWNQAGRLKSRATDAQKLVTEVSTAAASRTASGMRNEKIFNWVIQGFTYTIIGMTALSTSVGFAREMLLGEVAMIRARMEAYVAELRAIIKSIRAVIDDLIDALSSTGEHVKNTQKQINDMFKLVQFVC